MSTDDRFANLRYEDFRRMARDESLSKYERIGFPDSYRAGHEAAIFKDIEQKLTNLDRAERVVVDIGPGCSDLPRMLIAKCEEMGHALTLVDSDEMLSQLPDSPVTAKIPGLFPNCDGLAPLQGRADVVLCYSVLHYALVDVGFFRFLDAAFELLAPQGQLLLGDIPNVSKRKRFFASETGKAFHKAFTQTSADPEVNFNRVEHDRIDDAIVMAIAGRARASGFDAYVVPQDATLPMANRREDILVVRP